ncbi:molybdopterin molybdotransferase MoeA [Phenylobacterium sp. J426]|uniref:molybdopterin molybdotransferase MoeA n=1 Tax=Phenylobacterium sp. J426 TaxID=2898439 RepID=UPI0021518A18|nr:gephyrin-like molybdotransferase Glp [Phenylobacterium sp. J426]MCR5873563.1 molybdopterin molybdotransferase MoeA [Phenylobacterium sp. J426]
MKLLPVDEARARMLAEVPAAGVERVALAQASGRVLAEDVAAARDQPPFHASAMDGYAVRSADGAATLKVVGESAAGTGYAGVLRAGEAVRIFTGAALPEGADAVVIQEDATRGGDSVIVPETPAGKHVRPAGGDFRAGQALLAAGARLDPWRVSLGAAAGRADLVVARRPRVALFSTGEEIVEAPASPGPFQIYDSGSPALSAMIAGWGGEVSRARPVRDDLDATVEALRAADGELVVTIGGASVGDHDLVRKAGAALGLELKVASVNVRPGKPTFFGRLADGRLMLGLPGNPASAFVCAELFLRPILARWQGADPAPRTLAARLEEDLPANGSREHWMRAKLTFSDGGVSVRPFRDQDSSLVSVFAAADGLLGRQAEAPAAAAGDVVDVLPLSRLFSGA